ncbi:aminodeoxychorismate synthase component I [Sulfurimonas sp. SAG-AH-194-I05]|nr:aminodeoxychorismate synthase component I [Sulfurimonas sp. SAG-AH-194-I05]MDF1875807.1 aminodeoxychorismate synthase component I [Sulfurimonas sp. SAG-AH-194-I05]
MTFSDINLLGKKRKPFLFISDFKAQNVKVIFLEDLEKENIAYEMESQSKNQNLQERFDKTPQSFEKYKEKFDFVIEKIKAGETYLLNLTQETPIQLNVTLREMYTHANARYKLRYKDEFICFSPERFINIENNIINTYPMKGTIDASIPNAKESILKDEKEMAEHVMVVDLLRNDLSIKASNVKVESFRYITEIEAGEKRLLQVSSHVSGTLKSSWHEELGDILESLLPAGSISGAPKKSTLGIIQEIEGYERKYFTGVFGVYDGKTFDSAVMIRFIEKKGEGYVYKSGGGITVESDAQKEYDELVDKIYLP